MKLILILLIITSVAGGDVCPKIKANELSGGRCMLDIEKDSIFHLKVCTDTTNNTCLVNFKLKEVNCTPAVKPDPVKKYPGEYCDDKDYVCWVKDTCNMTTHRCMGKDLDADCENSSYCNPGFFCKVGSKKCVADGGKDAQCLKGNVNDTECKAGLVCSNNVCVEIGSLKNDSNASDPDACESHYIFDKKCAEAPYLKAAERFTKPIKCDENITECSYSDSNTSAKCECGNTETGSKYCPVKDGNINFTDYYAFVKYVLSKPNTYHSSCKLDCLVTEPDKVPTDYYKMSLVLLNRTNWHLRLDNTEIIQKMITKAYWDIYYKVYPKPNPKKDDDKFMLYLIIGISAGVVLIVTVLAVVLLMKKCKSSDTETGNLMEGDT